MYEYSGGGQGAPVEILKNIAHGTISDYVDPPTYTDVTGSRSYLLGVIKAGTKVTSETDLAQIGGVGSNPPEYYDQETMLLTADLDDQDAGVGNDVLPGLSSGLAPASCDAISKIGTGTVDAPAGKQTLVVYYSSDKGKTIKFASGVIDD